jgi:hypothetical protein
LAIGHQAFASIPSATAFLLLLVLSKSLLRLLRLIRFIVHWPLFSSPIFLKLLSNFLFPNGLDMENATSPGVSAPTEISAHAAAAIINGTHFQVIIWRGIFSMADYVLGKFGGEREMFI